MPKNATAMRPVPFLWIVGIADPIFFYGRDYTFNTTRRSIPKANISLSPGCMSRRRFRRVAPSSNG